jgi:hypothetical protein
MTQLTTNRPPIGSVGGKIPAAAPSKNFKKAPPPKLGEAFGPGPYDDLMWRHIPGGSTLLQFNLDKLDVFDFRQMRDHYQINASLAVLTFMMHQLDWKIVSDNERVAKLCETNMREIWTRLVRALSQAFWAGYSPCILQWENKDRAVQLTKIKDLRPELCEVNWDEVLGWAPPGHEKPKIRVYDGIKQVGLQWAIPPENTIWYTLLKENDNWYGRKLLRPAFTSWYFSILIHLYANHYMERFGEPTPIGRAPDEVVKNADGTETTGTQRMGQILTNLRNRGVVVLPDDRSISGTDAVYDYNIEYLESQMRGADFERYLMRLDEEISLALFTPLLILRTADVGSYNLGTGHWNVYQQMLNAIAGDWAEYIDRYILAPMVAYNFGINAKPAKILFRKLGAEQLQLATTMMQALIAGGKAVPDLEQLGDIAGLTVSEVKEVTSEADQTDPGAGDPTGADPASQGQGSDSATVKNSRRVAREIIGKMAGRACAQFRAARSSDKESFTPDFGHQRQLEVALGGVPQAGFSKNIAIAAGWMGDYYDSGLDTDESSVGAVLGRLFLGDR